MQAASALHMSQPALKFEEALGVVWFAPGSTAIRGQLLSVQRCVGCDEALLTGSGVQGSSLEGRGVGNLAADALSPVSRDRAK